MAKVPFSKLGLKKVKDDIVNIEFNGIEIEVKQYLPIEDKLQFVVNVISNAADGNRFYNPIKIEAFSTLEILFMYTNLSFTETQKKDLSKLFDIVVSNGLAKEVMAAIPKNELDGLLELVYTSANGIYEQMNSAMAVVESLTTQDTTEMSKQIVDLQEKLANPENLTLLRDVMNKLD